MKVGVFVGSFNPVHIGHEKLVNHLLNNNIVDKIIIIPTLSYWDKKVDISILDRINMLKTIENNNIIINEELNNIKYTYQILEELNKTYDNLYLIIGADNIIHFDKWNHLDYILKSHVIVVGRNDIDIKEFVKKFNSDHFVIVDDFDYKVSSSYIRERIKNNDFDSLEGLVNSDVIKYIKKNKLYV